MPKESHRRNLGHAPSVKLAKQQFVAHDNITDTGNTQPTNIPQVSDEESRNIRSEKHQRQSKREKFLQRLGSIQTPTSKSHDRRTKRKAKEQFASGFDDLKAIIGALDDGVTEEIHDSAHPPTNSSDRQRQRAQKAPTLMGKIGEGRNSTLSNAQRKRTLQTERLRHPLILSNPEFASNPFQTMRTHARNTLVNR